MSGYASISSPRRHSSSLLSRAVRFFRFDYSRSPSSTRARVFFGAREQRAVRRVADFFFLFFTSVRTLFCGPRGQRRISLSRLVFLLAARRSFPLSRRSPPRDTRSRSPCSVTQPRFSTAASHLFSLARLPRTRCSVKRSISFGNLSLYADTRSRVRSLGIMWKLNLPADSLLRGLVEDPKLRSGD